MTSGNRIPPDAVRTVAIIGAGLIGSSWAAWLMAHGLRVQAYDPAPDAYPRSANAIGAAWAGLRELGTAATPDPPQAVYAPSLGQALTGADFVLECGPERLAWKQETLAAAERHLPGDVILATCTSSLRVSDVQAEAERPERIVAAHPFNPPHLMPLVEVAGGKGTGEDALTWTEAFFRARGKVTVRVRGDSPGFIANRMTAALYREAVDLVASGTATVADVDAAIAHGPGLRWAIMGPHLLYHLGGGEKGYRGYLDHLGPAQEARWASLRTPVLDEHLKRRLVAELETELAGRSAAELAQARDRALIAVLKARG